MVPELWDQLESENDGGYRRLPDVQYPDFYAAIGVDGARGLVLLSDIKPTGTLSLDAVSVETSRRTDGKWVLAIWLRVPALSQLFGELCEALVRGSTGVQVGQLPNYVVGRLLDWQRLLEAGSSLRLGGNSLRGLVGELLVFRECVQVFGLRGIAAAWTGPLGASQDFILPDVLLEVKTIRPGAETISIASLAQLDTAGLPGIVIAVVSVAQSSSDDGSDFSIDQLVASVRSLASADADELNQFNAKLALSGYAEGADYGSMRFRFLSLRTYAVREQFPRLTRGEISSGIASASYDLYLAACEPFEVQLGLS